MKKLFLGISSLMVVILLFINIFTHIKSESVEQNTQQENTAITPLQQPEKLDVIIQKRPWTPVFTYPDSEQGVQNDGLEIPTTTTTTKVSKKDLVEHGSVMPKYYCVWGDFVLTEQEYNLLLTTTFCESGNQSLDTQFMTALTILNRLASGMFGNNLYEVIYAKDAFAVTKWSDFENRGWTPQVEEAVALALKENPHPYDMYYFRVNHYHTFAKDYMKSGDVYFSTQK